MENKIKELIQLWNEEYCKKGNAGLRKDQVIILKFLEDLQSLLKFKQKNCCGNPQDKSLITAFAQGASWWEWYKEKASMWQSDQLLAEEEAVRRLKGDTLGKTVEEIANENAKDKTE